MSTTDTPTPATASTSRTTGRQRAGLVLAGLFCLTNLPSVLVQPTPDGEVGPPSQIMLADTLLSAVGLVALVVFWRTGRRAALNVLAACVVLVVLTMLPAFFVDVPAWVKSLTGASVVWALVALVLSYSERGVTGTR